jgi:hypothetical protein
VTDSPATSLVILIVDQGVEPDVMEALEANGLDHFTRFSDVSGAGETGRREGNPIWPGLNTVLYIVMENERIQPLVDQLHAIRATYPITPGMKFIVVPAQMI